MKKLLMVAGLATAVAMFAAWRQDAPTLFKFWGLEDTVCLRGTTTLSNRQATVTLPNWFEANTLADGRTVLLTCKDGWSPLSTSAVANGQFTVSTNDSGNASQVFHWEVKVTRK